jgi:hypothetical protein
MDNILSKSVTFNNFQVKYPTPVLFKPVLFK